LRTLLEFQVAAVTARLRHEASAIRLVLAAKALERHYRADQPRAPRGTATGGQWIDDGVAGGSRPHRLVAATMFGKLLKEYRYGQYMILCIYDYGDEAWVLSYQKNGAVGCLDMVHQSTVFSMGSRLNDNWRRR
jgi:hypothetical protein